MQEIFFSKTDVLQHWGAHPGQTGLAIIDTNLIGGTATSAIVVVRELIVGYLHNPRYIERAGECKQEGFKSNLLIIKSIMEVKILSRIE